MPRTAPSPRRRGRHRATGPRPARPTSRRPPTATPRNPHRPPSGGPRSRRPRAGRRRGPRCPRRRVPCHRAPGPAARRPRSPGRRPGSRRPGRTTARERAAASATPRAPPQTAQAASPARAAIAQGLLTPWRQPVIAPDAIPIGAATTTPRPVNAPNAAPTAVPGARRCATAAPGARRCATAAPGARRGRTRRVGSSGSGRAGRGRWPTARCWPRCSGCNPALAVGVAAGAHRGRRRVDLSRVGTLGPCSPSATSPAACSRWRGCAATALFWPLVRRRCWWPSRCRSWCCWPAHRGPARASPNACW